MIIARISVQLLVEVKLAKEIFEAQIFTKEAKFRSKIRGLLAIFSSLIH